MPVATGSIGTANSSGSPSLAGKRANRQAEHSFIATELEC